MEAEPSLCQLTAIWYTAVSRQGWCHCHASAPKEFPELFIANVYACNCARTDDHGKGAVRTGELRSAPVHQLVQVSWRRASPIEAA